MRACLRRKARRPRPRWYGFDLGVKSIGFCLVVISLPLFFPLDDCADGLETLPTAAVSLAALVVAVAAGPAGPRACAAVARIIAEASLPLVEFAAMSRVGAALRVAMAERPQRPVHCWPRPHWLEAQAMEPAIHFVWRE
jgi:hypothetical protein